jgi:hypothetical protein
MATRLNRRLRHSAGTAATPGGGGFDAFDVMSMRDTWEYAWFAAWI